MLHSSGAGTTAEWLGCAGCTRACCSWSLAFWGSFWPVLPLPSRSFGRCALASSGAGDIRWRMNEAIRPGQGTQAVVTPEVSVVVPTFNERDNVVALFRKLETALAGVAWEVIY